MKNKKGIIICMIMISILLLGGCGTKISHKSPEAVVKSLISAYQNQDEEAVKKAFGVNPDKKCAEEKFWELFQNTVFLIMVNFMKQGILLPAEI